MNSPFPYETYAIGKYFYGREDEIETVHKYISNSNNLVIYSKRRMGKSSLIKEALRRLDSSYLYLYTDIYEIISPEDFGASLLKSLANAQKGDLKTVMAKLTSLLKRTRVEPSIDPNTLEYTIKPIVQSLSFDEMIDDFFCSIFKLSETKKIAVVIDEFQQIAMIKEKRIDAILRKYIQENKNISYIFLGSKRHMLSTLFEYKSPLFEMATPLVLGSLEVEAINSYVSKNLVIDLDCVHSIFELADGETKLIQHILHILYLEYGDKKIDQIMIKDALKEIIDAKSSAYRVIYDTFSPNQKKAFKQLSKYKKNLLTHRRLAEQNISKSSMQAGLKQLYGKEFIDKDDDRWFVPDRAFELWGETI